MKALTDSILTSLYIERDGEEVNQDYKNGIETAISIIEEAEKSASFEEIARVIMKHLANPKKYHPHHLAVIDSTNAQLLEGKESTGQTLDYITD